MTERLINNYLCLVNSGYHKIDRKNRLKRSGYPLWISTFFNLMRSLYLKSVIHVWKGYNKLAEVDIKKRLHGVFMSVDH